MKLYYGENIRKGSVGNDEESKGARYRWLVRLAKGDWRRVIGRRVIGRRVIGRRVIGRRGVGDKIFSAKKPCDRMLLEVYFSISESGKDDILL
jgi:hypothetical protein